MLSPFKRFPSLCLPQTQTAQQHAVKLSQVEGPVTHWCIFQAIGWPSFSAAYSSMSCDRRLKRAPCGWAPRDCSSCCACAYVCWLLQHMSCTNTRFQWVHAATSAYACWLLRHMSYITTREISVGQCSHMCIRVLAVAPYVLHHHQVFIMTIFGAQPALIT